MQLHQDCVSAVITILVTATSENWAASCHVEKCKNSLVLLECSLCEWHKFDLASSWISYLCIITHRHLNYKSNTIHWSVLSFGWASQQHGTRHTLSCTDDLRVNKINYTSYPKPLASVLTLALSSHNKQAWKFSMTDPLIWNPLYQFKSHNNWK